MALSGRPILTLRSALRMCSAERKFCGAARSVAFVMWAGLLTDSTYGWEMDWGSVSVRCMYLLRRTDACAHHAGRLAVVAAVTLAEAWDRVMAPLITSATRLGIS